MKESRQSKKLETFQVNKGMSLDKIRQTLKGFLENQGLEIKPSKKTNKY